MCINEKTVGQFRKPAANGKIYWPEICLQKNLGPRSIRRPNLPCAKFHGFLQFETCGIFIPASPA
jgi:hypothetical protein